MADDLTRAADARSATASRPRGPADVGLGLAALGYAAVLVVSDVADADHALWRDHLSYFGSAEAPYPLAYALAQALLAIVVLVWLATRRSGLGRFDQLALTVAALAAIGAAVWPIDCSPTDTLCEVIIRGRAVSTSHDVHSILAVVLFSGLSACAVSVAARIRTPSAAVVAGAAVAGTVWIVARPFSSGSGLVELGVVAACGWNLTRLWSGPIARPPAARYG